MTLSKSSTVAYNGVNTLNFTELGSPFEAPPAAGGGSAAGGGNSNAAAPNSSSGGGSSMDTQHGPQSSNPDGHGPPGSGLNSKSAFIELQQHGFNAIRGGYQHFASAASQGHHHQDATGFPSPRSALGYSFPAMQNTYTGYHLGSYAPPCASPPKDGEF